MGTDAVPPLVAQPVPLSDDQRHRYVRHVSLRGIHEQGQGRLLGARVAVVGAGGLGVPIVRYLAAAGVGDITVIDDDVVDVTNVHRQVAYSSHDSGFLKADVLAKQITRAYPDTRIHAVPQRLSSDNAKRILGYHHVVLDGTDNFATRELIDATCADLEIPVVWGAIHAWYGQVAVLWQRPTSAGTPSTRMADMVDPVAAAQSDLSCAADGVMGPLCGQVGSVMALEAVKLITGAGQPLLGRTMLIDAWSAQTTVLEVRPRAGEHATGHDSAMPAQPGTPPVGDQHGHHGGLEGITSGEDAVSVDQFLLAEVQVATMPWRVIDLRIDRQDNFPGAEHINLVELLNEDPSDKELLLVCHNGSRARDAVPSLRSRGHRARYLVGGYLAWSDRA